MLDMSYLMFVHLVLYIVWFMLRCVGSPQLCHSRQVPGSLYSARVKFNPKEKFEF